MRLIGRSTEGYATMKSIGIMVGAAVIGIGLFAGPAQAADQSYLGVWTVRASQRAPWAAADEKPVESDLKALMHKQIVFRADRIAAPQPLNCKKPNYEIKSYAADMLFQGSLTEPAKQAAAIGFQGATIVTLETGCEGAIDFHFLDQNTAMFALNNRLYRLERKQP